MRKEDILLYHLTVSIVGKSKGIDATAAVAYITRSEVEDRTTGMKFDHTHHKDKPMFTERYLPEKHPAWAEVQKYKKGKYEYLNYGELWNNLEEYEKRKDAQLARNFNVAFQDEFTDEENEYCFSKWIKENFISRGFVVDAAGHLPHKEKDGTDNKNKHGHALSSIRPMMEDGWNPKKDRDANSKEFLNQIRKSWADINNKVFEKKFLAKYQKEYDELEEVLQDILPDEEERNKEKVQLLYDKYPNEWIYISEKTLDEQRAEVEQWLEEEEEKENLNMERISRLEKKFLSIPFEAQRHVGAKAKAMQRKGKKTDRQAYESDPKKKNREVEAELNAVTVSDEELDAELSKDSVYKSLKEARAAILKQISENINDCEEVKMIQKQVDAIKTLEEMNQWIESVWRPIETRIRLAAERNAAYNDIKSEHSEIVSAYKEIFLENLSDTQKKTVQERRETLSLFIENEKDNSFSDSEVQNEELSGTLGEMTLLQRVSQKFKNVLKKIKEKAGEIIEKSSLMKFKIFRAQRQIVNDWQPEVNVEVISDGRTVNSGTDKSDSGHSGQIIDFSAGFESYTRNVDSERSKQAVAEAERRDNENREQTERRKTGKSKDNERASNSNEQGYGGRS